MNERIRDLQIQAFAECKTFEDSKFKTDEVFERFAELIVHECIRTIQMGISRDGHNTEKYQRSMRHIKQVKEHFGVKE